MRPHRLTLTAFGSFPGTETVDFDTLSEAGLFLVHGPTGAGKTTLLDALCFALYGVVPGQRNSARSLRCDHAPPSVGPSVTLEVTLRGRLLRIQRSPAWTRPKLRGTGVTEEKAKVIVSEHVREEGWQGLTTRADEAGDLVGGLLGMNADQFCQVAMLPQGDFARFLRADGEERRRLLERLFTVKVFTAAEAWLAERRKQTWRESQEGRQEVEYAVKRLEEAAGDVLEAASSRPDGLACAADGDGLVSAPGTGAGGDGSGSAAGGVGLRDDGLVTAPGAALGDDGSGSAPGVIGAGGDGSGSAPGAMGRVADGRGSVPGGVGPDAEGLDPGSHVPAPRAARSAAVRAVSPGAVPAPRSGADDPPTAESDPLAWSGLLRAAAAAVVNRATQACEAGEAALREHRERFERASALADRQRRHADALAQRRTFDERAEERSDLLTVLDEAARADRVLPLINAARQRAAAASKARHLATDAIARATPFLDTRAHLAPTTPTPGSRPAVDPLTSSGAPQDKGREAFDDGGRPGGPDLDEPGADAHRPGRSPGRPDAYALGDGGFPGRSEAGSPGFAVAPGVLAELERERLGEITRVSELLADESRLVQLRHELRAGEQEIVALSTRERAAAARLEELPGLVKAADDAVAKARLDAAMIPGAEVARSGAATRLEAIERRDHLLADLAAARTALAARLRDPALAYALTDLLTHLTGPAEAHLTDLTRSAGRAEVTRSAGPAEADLTCAAPPGSAGAVTVAEDSAGDEPTTHATTGVGDFAADEPATHVADPVAADQPGDLPRPGKTGALRGETASPPADPTGVDEAPGLTGSSRTGASTGIAGVDETSARPGDLALADRAADLLGSGRTGVAGVGEKAARPGDLALAGPAAGLPGSGVAGVGEKAARPGGLPLDDLEAGRIRPGRTGVAGGEAATRPVIDELVAWLTDPVGAEHAIRRRDLALGDALANLADHLADSGDTSVAAAAAGPPGQQAPWRSVTAWARPAERAMRDQLAALEGLRADEARLAELDERLAVLTGELGTLAEREATGRAAVDELPATLHDMAARLAEARAAAGRLPSAAAARDAAASRLAAAGRRQELEGDLEAARAAHGMAVELAQDLRDRLQEVRQARIDGMAAELAAELADGQPCAVCGSAEHPAPAAPAGIAYAADDEIEAQAAYDAALAERQASDGLLSSLISRLDELAEAPAPEVAEAELAVVEGEMAVLAALAGEESACERAVLALESELDQARDQLHETERRLTEARAEVSALTGERERIHARLEAARGADAGLGARRRRLGDEIRLLTELTRTAERAEEITARLDDALDTLARLLAPASVPAAASVDSRADDGGFNGSATGHPGAGHPGAGHFGAEHSDAGHPGSGHYGAEHSGTGHSGTGHSGGITGGGVVGDAPSSVAAGAALSSPDWSRPDGGDGADERQPEVAARQADPRTWAARVTRAWAAAELDAADREVARLRSAAAAHPRLASRAAELAAEHAGTADAFRELGLRLAACRTRCEELEAETVRLASRIDAARGADPTLTARLERLREEAQLMREAHEATQAAEAAAAEHRKAVEAAKQAAVAAGFADVEDVLPAVRTSEERERKAERLRELDAAHAAVTRALADPELVAAAAEPVPDLAAMAAAREEAERAHTALASARDRAERRVRRLAELHEELVACLDRWQPAADRHRLAERLAALANGTSGDNQWSMSLSSYVLGERLRQVVDAANERLDHMSDGRYQLQHDLRKTAGARGRAGGGLGLRVLDAWTGVDRDPATLSGGESFITSLALALGLADVVSAEAGGAEIGMLFVDEGFGTLDEDTLDGVLDILDGLRDGGRAVGIVSHVGELRTRIPAQLKVTKARAGSTLSVTAP
ncbi:AAA family ATPase [Nonomuraea sp. NPDC003804]|uniref:AAA family ATPase n=1 Tax=Nonomuraea sp. NPDC003804 TaxID=3154547 RepID=UPI0033A91065